MPRDQANVEAKALLMFELPKLKFDSKNQDPNLYGSLRHGDLNSIGLGSFVPNDHVHELNDIVGALSASRNDVMSKVVHHHGHHLHFPGFMRRKRIFKKRAPTCSVPRIADSE